MIATSSLHYLRLIERRLQVGTWTLDLRSGHLACSEGMLRLLRLPPDSHPSLDALIGRVHPDDRWIVDELLRESEAPDDERRFRVSLPDEPTRWFGCWIDAIATDPRAAWVRRGLIRDVTRSQASLARLTRSHRIFDTLVRASGGVVLRLDARGAAHGQDAWVRDTGQSPDDLRRKGWTAALHPEDREGAARAWSRAMETGAAWEGVFRLRGPDGAYAPMRLRCEPAVTAEGRLLEWVFFLSPPETAPEAKAPGAAPTPAQLRGCRGLLDWTVSRLATASDVSPATIVRYEAGDGAEGAIRATTLAKLRRALEQAGVEFVPGSAGIAIRLAP